MPKRGLEEMSSGVPQSVDHPKKKPKLNHHNVSNRNGDHNHNNDNICGLDDEEEKDMTNDEIKHRLLSSGEPILLNIGGRTFATTLTTLSSERDSILYKMFDEKWSLKPSKDGSYFIDRNGRYFEYILDYMRNNTLNIPSDKHIIRHLISEAEYYQLSALKSSLLLFQSGSKILRTGDVEFIEQCFREEYPNYKDMRIQDTTQIYSGTVWPKYKTVLRGLESLLFLFICNEFGSGHCHRFGMYLKEFVWSDIGREGFSFELDSCMTGTHKVHKKHSTLKLQHFIHNLAFPDTFSRTANGLKLFDTCIEIHEDDALLELIISGCDVDDEEEYTDTEMDAPSGVGLREFKCFMSTAWDSEEAGGTVCKSTPITHIEIYRV
eukprot:909421_1